MGKSSYPLIRPLLKKKQFLIHISSFLFSVVIYFQKTYKIRHRSYYLCIQYNGVKATNTTYNKSDDMLHVTEKKKRQNKCSVIALDCFASTLPASLPQENVYTVRDAYFVPTILHTTAYIAYYDILTAYFSTAYCILLYCILCLLCRKCTQQLNVFVLCLHTVLHTFALCSIFFKLIFISYLKRVSFLYQNLILLIRVSRRTQHNTVRYTGCAQGNAYLSSLGARYYITRLIFSSQVVPTKSLQAIEMTSASYDRINPNRIGLIDETQDDADHFLGKTWPLKRALQIRIPSTKLLSNCYRITVFNEK